MQLIIGNKNYSSWSMRPWILLRHYGVEFEEIRIPLFVDGYQAKLGKYSPTLKVPVLIDGELNLWDSLAICEYISEKYLAGRALPKDIARRALCRSYCSEMHSGFTAIRTHLPMNCRAQKEFPLSTEVQAECRRVDQLWSEARRANANDGDYLCGEFSLADCMFAPMAMRFHTYAVGLSDSSQEYLQTLRRNEAIRRWCKEAAEETEILPDYEIGSSLSG